MAGSSGLGSPAVKRMWVILSVIRFGLWYSHYLNPLFCHLIALWSWETYLDILGHCCCLIKLRQVYILTLSRFNVISVWTITALNNVSFSFLSFPDFPFYPFPLSLEHLGRNFGKREPRSWRMKRFWATERDFGRDKWMSREEFSDILLGFLQFIPIDKCHFLWEFSLKLKLGVSLEQGIRLRLAIRGPSFVGVHTLQRKERT